MRKLSIAVALSALLLASCGGGGPSAKESPRDAFTEALNRLRDAAGLTLTFSLASTTDDLVALSEGSLTEEQANWILSSSLTFAANKSEDPEDAQAEISADVADVENAVQIHVVGNTLYVRADVQALAELFGADTSQLDAFAQQAEAQGMNFIRPALDGEWIALEGLDQLSQAAGTTQDISEQQQKVMDKFVQSLSDSAEATFEGADDIGDHLVVTIPLRDAYQNFAELGQELGGAPIPPPTEIPDEDATVDVWLDGGSLVQIQLDFLQFADLAEEDIPEGVDELALRLGVEEGEISVEEPDDATKVDLQQLMQMFMGGVGGGAAPQPAPGGDDMCLQIAEQLRGQPQEVIDQAVQELKAQCPDLENQI
jgi:hypothetical protein